MTWVSLKSLMERRTRAVLTAMAIVLGVAMIAGSLILTDTIDRAFTDVFGASYTKTDLVVRGTPVVEDSLRGRPHGPRLPPAPHPGASPASPRPAATSSTSPAPATRPRCSTRTGGHHRQQPELRLRHRPVRTPASTR